MSSTTIEDQPSIYSKLREKAVRDVHYDYRTGRTVPASSLLPAEGGREQRQSRMLGMNDSVIELWRQGDDELFEAAVQTDEGPKNLKGSVVGSCLSADVQSGAVAVWRTEFQETNKTIRNAYDTQTPREAVQTISTIREQLERTSELAAARSSLLLGKLEKPKLAPLPHWFESQRSNLTTADEDEVVANPQAIAVAELLVRAVTATIPNNSELTAEVETGPMGRVVVDWRVSKGRVQWMIDALETSWPSVKVFQVSHRSENGMPKSLETHVFFNAFDAVDSLTRFLANA
jgi:hypothetical protein